MEDDGIELVLARATELRLKISNCIHRATHASINGPIATQHVERNQVSNSHLRIEANEALDEETEEEEEERLLNLCGALESLETQLSSLQVLRQQQLYEREVALAEIENSRKILIDKLEQYKGKELEVIREASTFASETVEHNNDLLLPPYPSRPPYSVRLDKDYLLQFSSRHKLSAHDSLIPIDPQVEAKTRSEKEQNHVQGGAKSMKRLRFLIKAAKTMLVVGGVVSILSLSGVGPNFEELRTRVLSLCQQPDNKNQISSTHCPPGRILVVENGEARCLVKERVEVPFSAVAAKPDINYGSG